ncbi:hypothetical protein ABPG72_009856 [Tetrahymena utriculariae]
MIGTPKSQGQNSFFDSKQQHNNLIVMNHMIQREHAWNDRIVVKEMTPQYRKLKERYLEKLNSDTYYPRSFSNNQINYHSQNQFPLKLQNSFQVAPLSAMNNTNSLLSPRNQQLQALEIKRKVLKKYQPQVNLPQHIHMTHYSLKIYLEELFQQLKNEWNLFNIPVHHKEIYAELLRHIPKDQAVGFIQKEMQKVKSNQSNIQQCMMYIDQREQSIGELEECVNEYEQVQDAKLRIDIVEKISKLLVHIRQITLYVVESICKWKDGLQLYLSSIVDDKKQSFIIAYIYNNDNYLLKIQTDLIEYSDRNISQYFNFSTGIDPFLMDLTISDSSKPYQITHFIPKLAKKRIEHLQDRLQKELKFSEENEKQQQLLLFNPNATQYLSHNSNNISSSSLMKLKSLKYKKQTLKTQSSASNSNQQMGNEKVRLSRFNFRQRSLQPSFSQKKKLDTDNSPSGSIINSPQKSKIKNLPIKFNKTKQLEEISIQPCMLSEEQLHLFIKNYFEEFKASAEEENPFLKSFPFDHIEVITEIKIQQETNAFFIYFREYTKKGLLITHIDKYNFDERKLIISHFSIQNLSLEQDAFLFDKTLDQVKKFLFLHDPCSEIQIALVTFERDDFMFGVNEKMESAIKQNQFIQVEYQDDYDSQLYYHKRPQNQPKKKQLQQIEPVFYELQSCITLKGEPASATPQSQENNFISNGSVNIALLFDIQKGELKQEIQSMDCDWQKVAEFDNLSKEYELLKDIKHSEYSTASDLNDYLNRLNSIFDFSDKIKEKKQIYYSNTEQYFRWNSSQQIMIDELPYVRINFMLGYSSIYQIYSEFMYHPIYLIETHHTNTFFFIVQMENDQQQKDFDDLCKDLAERQIVIQELNPIEDGKNIIFPQFSIKQKREKSIADNLVMYQQLIFSNDFEPSMKSIKYKPYDSQKDILIMRPLAFGMLNIDILQELNSVLFAAVYKK